MSIPTRRLSVLVHPKRIDLIFADRQFFAVYSFLNNIIGYLTEVPDAYFQIMMWIFLKNLDEVELPDPDYLFLSWNMLMNFSGGTDSAAALYLTQGIPVHINRVYKIRQMRACEEVSALQIVTDFERVSEMYIGRHGFNIGTGYMAMYIPVMPLLGCNSVVFGTVLEDFELWYVSIPDYRERFKQSSLYSIKETLGRYGLKIYLLLAGHSEVLSVQLAEKSGIKNHSSCHTAGDIIPAKILSKLKTKPLYAASSTVYAIQKAGYPHKEFCRYMDLDVSFYERVNKNVNYELSCFKTTEFPWQTEADQVSIAKFVQAIENDL
jgi:hypothetical protein